MTRLTLTAVLVLLATLPARADDAKPAVVPFELLKTKHITLDIKVNGKGPYRVIFDTGAPMTVLNNKLAKEAGQELVTGYGFKKLPVRDPFAAPVGAVLVYGAKHAAGHVEIRTKDGFVSDFRSKKPSRRPLLGVYAKS